MTVLARQPKTNFGLRTYTCTPQYADQLYDYSVNKSDVRNEDLFKADSCFGNCSGNDTTNICDKLSNINFESRKFFEHISQQRSNSCYQNNLENCYEFSSGFVGNISTNFCNFDHIELNIITKTPSGEFEKDVKPENEQLRCFFICGQKNNLINQNNF